MRRAVGEELRGVQCVGGGFGVIVVTSSHAPHGRNLSADAVTALSKAAWELGFRRRESAAVWGDVVDAIAAGCLPDLLSEAIVAVEGYGSD
jgi:hypothetical protein